MALLTGACTDTSSPLAIVLLRTEVTPAAAAPGDTVTIRAILTNPSSRLLDISSNCGPPVLFEVGTSTGIAIYPVPLNAPFTCEKVDTHDLDAGETDTVSTRWRVSVPAGQYSVRSGFRNSGGGLERLSSGVVLTVR